MGGMNLAKNSIPDDPRSCYSFLVDKDGVLVFVGGKKGIQNKASSPARIFASTTKVETTISKAINCLVPLFIFYHLEL